MAMIKISFVLALACGALAGLFGCWGPQRDAPPLPQTDSEESDKTSNAAPPKAAVCATCHGPDGISSNSLWPNLAGQKREYLIKQLEDFRSGARKDPLMAGQAASLSDEDIESLADYYSSL